MVHTVIVGGLFINEIPVQTSEHIAKNPHPT